VSLRQALAPEALRARINATMRFAVWGTIPLGALLGGALGSALGLRPTLWISAIGGLTAALWLLRSPVRSLAAMPDGPDPDVAGGAAGAALLLPAATARELSFAEPAQDSR
jgi:hypothetical protein